MCSITFLCVNIIGSFNPLSKRKRKLIKAKIGNKKLVKFSAVALDLQEYAINEQSA